MAYNPYTGESSGSKKSSGGGSSYNPYTGESGGGKKPKKSKHHANKKHHHGLLGLTANLVHDVGDAAVGIPKGIYGLGKAVTHDTIDAANGGGHNFHLDDLGKDTLKAMAYTYTPLAHGNVREFGKRVYDHPLGPVLDALTLVTLGAGGAVKGAKVLGDAGEAGSAFHKLSGGTAKVARDGLTAADEVDLLQAGRHRGQGRVGAASEDGVNYIAPSDRVVATKTGDTGVVGTHSENPFRRQQEKAYDAISRALGLNDRRIVKATAKANRDVMNREGTRVGLSAAHKAADDIAKRDDAEVLNLAVANQSKAGHVDDVQARATAEAARLEQEHGAVTSTTDHAERQHSFIKRVVGRATGQKARDRALAEVERIQKSEKDLRAAAEEAAAMRRHRREAGKGDLSPEAVSHLERRIEGEGALADPSAEMVDTNSLRHDLWVERDGKHVRFDEAVRHEGEHQDLHLRVDDIEHDIRHRGFDEPIRVKVDKRGRKILEDGMARVIAADRAGRNAVPVVITDAVKGGVTPKDFGMKVRDPLHEAQSATKSRNQAMRLALLENKAKIKLRELELQRKSLSDVFVHGEHAVEHSRQLVKARKDRDWVKPQLAAKIELQKRLAEHGLDEEQTKLVNAMVKTAHHVVTHDEAGTNAQLARMAEGRGKPGARSRAERNASAEAQGLAPIEPGGFEFPRTMDRSKGERTAKQAAGGRKSPDRAPVPDSAKHSSNYNERFGLDAADPKMVVATHQVMASYNQSLANWRPIVDAITDIPEGGIPKGYRRVPQGIADRFYDTAKTFFDDVAPVAFGEDNPIVQHGRELMVDHLGKRFKNGPQMVPEKLYDKMMSQMAPRKHLPGDRLIGLWRMSVVSPLRPAFLVNNFIGQSAMLLTSQAGLGMFRDIMHGVAHGDLLAEHMGGVVGSGQAAFMRRESSHLLRDGSEGRIARAAAKGATANDWLGGLSQALTDDPFRRLSFGMEAAKAAKPIMKRLGGTMIKDAETGAMRPFVMRDAFEMVVKDDRTISRIEQKVFGDLVDFGDLSHGEREVVRRILPFYTWIKGSSRFALKLALDDPLYAELLTRTGTQGAKEMQADAGGVLPDYMRGLLGLGDGGKDGKDSSAFTTAQFSPFVTPSDTLAQLMFTLGVREKGQQPFNPDNPLSQTNPLIKAGIAAFTGKDPFSGQASNPGRVLATSFPLVGSFGIPGVLQGNASRPDGVYGHSVQNELAKYFGVPIRENVDVNKAKYLATDPYQFAEGSVSEGRDGKRYFKGADGRLYMEIHPKKKKAKHD